MPQLGDIAARLLAAEKQLDPDTRLGLEGLLPKTNAVIEALLFLLSEEAAADLQPLLSPVVDELFLDAHLAISLAMAGRFKVSLVIARTLLENSVCLAYFVDHPVEARMWAEAGRDMNFGTMMDEMSQAEYLRAATCRIDPDNENRLQGVSKELVDLYRELSERVHGKFSFLQQAPNNSDRLLASRFVSIFERMMTHTVQFLCLRVRNREALLKRFPKLESAI